MDIMNLLGNILQLIGETPCTLIKPNPPSNSACVFVLPPTPPPQTSPWLHLKHCNEKCPLEDEKGNQGN